jgi:hypothetical protein
MNTDSFEHRMRAAVLLYALERDLGKYVKGRREGVRELGATVASSIAMREYESGRTIDAGDPGAIVGASYLDELRTSEGRLLSRVESVMR